MSLPVVLSDFLAAIEKRDVDAVSACFTADATYAYAVPLPPLVGRDAIAALFGPLLAQAESAAFEVVGYCVEGDRVWTERIDRFTFDGREVFIECAGVFDLADGKISAVRDYVDMETWRSRKGS
ncbi:MAG TPA: nuclear transport factor 2 family protein [Sporichthya sp.]|nr:nuclear transport factor 2 family protein [Sporichthya sp.]